MAITDPIHFDPTDNFFGRRFADDDFDELMVGLVARVNLLMQGGGGEGPGVPGETPQLRVNAGWVQYKYPSQLTWTNLFEIPSDGQDGVNGTNGTNGLDGGQGPQGKSAYQVAVDNGFVGSEAAWLFSLKGADGEDGEDGSPATNLVTSVNGEQGAVQITRAGLGAASAADLDNVFGIAQSANTAAEAAQATANEAKGKADTAVQPAGLLVKGVITEGDTPTGPNGFYIVRPA